ncbi:hypothetical protein [Photorhabdus luminescens]|uniref:hypothetical protein n=1 Tax=Photorhabdus luminescens TaxID=29488 RepID=UPI001863EBF8|nr:hypothetical protein [Photorhabdus luminescens]
MARPLLLILSTTKVWGWISKLDWKGKPKGIPSQEYWTWEEFGIAPEQVRK